MSEILTVGGLARRTGVSGDTIRHYDRLGLLPQVVRSSGGYRLFPPATVDRIWLIRHAVRVGFSLRQLSTFLRARHAGGAPCHDVRDAAARILEAIEQQITDLTATRETIRTLLNDWNDRLANTAPGQPAHLLESLSISTVHVVRRPVSNLKRSR